MNRVFVYLFIDQKVRLMIIWPPKNFFNLAADTREKSKTHKRKEMNSLAHKTKGIFKGFGGCLPQFCIEYSFKSKLWIYFVRFIINPNQS
jgi:hypothetical protein